MTEKRTNRTHFPVAGIVVDLQNDYCHPEGALARTGLDTEPLEAVIQPVNVVTNAIRSVGGLVIYLTSFYTDAKGDFLIPAMARHGRRRWNGLGDQVPFVREGHWGGELHARLEVHEEDAIVRKHHFDGFFKSRLGDVLGSIGGLCDLVVVGVTTDVCVLFTAQEAFQRGYNITVPEECVNSYDPVRHTAALGVLDRAIGRVLSLDQVLSEL